jgi:hypothetical protein
MSGRFGKMLVIDSDQFRGRLYWCPCGWLGWTVWGHALRHAQTCPKARA